MTPGGGSELKPLLPQPTRETTTTTPSPSMTKLCGDVKDYLNIGDGVSFWVENKNFIFNLKLLYLLMDLEVILALTTAAANHRGGFSGILVADWVQVKNASRSF